VLDRSANSATAVTVTIADITVGLQSVDITVGLQPRWLSERTCCIHTSHIQVV